LSSIIFTPSLADETYNFYQDGWTRRTTTSEVFTLCGRK
jgi:hypothetical protein